MKKLQVLMMILVSAFIASCGSDGTIAGGGTPQGTTGVGSVTVLASSPQVPSDQSGGNTVEISAMVQDANNALMPNVAVIFTATSGALGIINAVTDNSGVARAQLSSGGDPTNRTITVSALAGSASGSG